MNSRVISPARMPDWTRAACIIFGLLVLGRSLHLGAEYPQNEDDYPAAGYAWENNRLGMDTSVPAPWTALRHDAGGVDCWGRRYSFDAGAVCSQITSQGKKLFAAPPKLSLRMDGKDLSLETGGETRVDVDTEQKHVRTWSSKAGGHAISVASSLEYDGFLHIALRVMPDKSATIDRLALELSLPRAQATMLNRFEEYDFEAQHVNHDNVLGSASRIDSAIAMGFTPSLWIGNHQVGIEWSCETNAGWSPVKSREAVQILPGADACLVRINVIAQPRRITAPFEWNFALMPTPVKPRPENWRRLRLTTSLTETGDYSKGDRVFGFGMSMPVKYRGLPLMTPRSENSARDVARQRATVADNHAGFIPYGALYALPGILPEGEWKDYAAKWRVDLKGGSVANVNWGNSLGLPKGVESLIYICPSQRSLQDYMVWQYVRAIEQSHISGTYFDVASQNYTCVNPNHAHAGPREEGWQYFPLFSQRRLMQRLYVACRARDPGFLITQHCAMQSAVTSGFTDVVIKGEALNRSFKRPGFTIALAGKDPSLYEPDYGALPAEYFEVNFSPQQGPVLMLLPQITKWNTELMAHDDARRTRLTRRMLARAAVVDVLVMNSMADRPLCRMLDKMKVRSGIADGAEFHGPRESAAWLSSGGVKLHTGVYFKTREHGVALIVANLSDAPVQETFQLNMQALQSAGITPGHKATILNMFTGEETTLAADAPVSLELAPDELRMVVWE